jgi:hypothetical protein
MNDDQKPIEDILRRGLEVLLRELGTADTLRFLQKYSPGRGDYTQERRELFNHLTVDEIVEQIKKSRPAVAGA